MDQAYSNLTTRLFASAVLWGVTAYNIIDLWFYTIPELVNIYKALKGKIGFTLKHILRISVVTELMELNVVFLAICLFLAITSRTLVASTFSFFHPWVELLTR